MNKEDQRQLERTAAVDLEKNASDPRSAVLRAIALDPDRIIFIGTNPELERMAAEAGHRVEVLPAGIEVPADASEVLPSCPFERAAGTTPEVDIFAVLLASARAGEPIHIQGPMTGTGAMMHISTIERLKRETGKAVCVIYS